MIRLLPESRFIVPARRVAGWLMLFGMLASPGVAHPAIDMQIDITTELIKEGPTAALYLKRGELHREHAEYDKALLDLDAAAKLDPELAGLALCRAQTMHDVRKFSEAVQLLDVFIAKNPAHTKGLLLRARVLMDMARHAEALRDFDAVIRLAKESSPEIYLERAKTLETLQRPEDALASLEEGLRRIGDINALHMAAWELERRLARHDAALARIEGLLARAERKERWHLRRAQCLADLRRDADAQKACQDALAALEQLPPAQRQVLAMRELEQDVQAMLQRFSSKSEQ